MLGVNESPRNDDAQVLQGYSLIESCRTKRALRYAFITPPFSIPTPMSLRMHKPWGWGFFRPNLIYRNQGRQRGTDGRKFVIVICNLSRGRVSVFLLYVSQWLELINGTQLVVPFMLTDIAKLQ